MAEGYRQLDALNHYISQKVRSFRTFSELLEALQYETAHVAYIYIYTYIHIYIYIYDRAKVKV